MKDWYLVFSESVLTQRGTAVKGQERGEGELHPQSQFAGDTNLGRNTDLWRMGKLYRGIWTGWMDGLRPVG